MSSCFALYPVIKWLIVNTVYMYLSVKSVSVSSVRYGALGAPKTAGPRPHSPPHSTERPGVRRRFLGFPTSSPDPAHSLNGPLLMQVVRNVACTGNELGLAPDGGGGGDYPQKCPPSPCRDRASGVKTRPAVMILGIVAIFLMLF